ncbi:HNH endonuclease [Acinetobacter higginsii]|uniref:HNH endonuclease n=1 Tax=Acinetobacter higginsii TaxID=70347 RepID=UPI001F4B8664|nr:HNH endonuclease [Acinetobacter higginsii]MCH7338426.1 HNH endonuclease [Acinetobacter higginsii]
MPLISLPFVFDPKLKSTLKSKLKDPYFTHNNWGDDEFSDLRSLIRSHYRDHQNTICAYCKAKVSLVSASNAHIEHIVPKATHLQFIFEPKNLCVICADCNTIKRNQETSNDIKNPLVKLNTRYPRSSKAFKIVHPHFDNYDDHIAIKGKIYIDITPKGNFTIGACKLNRYFQKFGVDQDFIDDSILMNIFQKFMSSQSSIEKNHLLEELKTILICNC